MKMPIVFHAGYSPHFNDDHRFPMAKFKLLYNHLQKIGVVDACELFTPIAATIEQVAMAHCKSYINAYRENTLTPAELKKIGLPWTKGVMERTFLAVGGSILCTDLAIERGIAAHLAGGTHHAHFDFGSGFCIFNDLVICARHALKKPGLDRVMIIDVDVHQGDGTARLLADEPNVVTVSIHCQQNFPTTKATSDHDIELDKKTDDKAYLKCIKTQIPYLLDIYQPDFVLYDAGVDPHKDDLLGLLCLSSEGIYQRDKFIINECAERKIPVSCVIGGGYMKDQHELAKVHSLVHQAALAVWQDHYE